MSEILELIDNAIGDYSTSGDAMRWTPEPATPPRLEIDRRGSAHLVEASPAASSRPGLTPTQLVINGVDLTHFVVDAHLIPTDTRAALQALPDASLTVEFLPQLPRHLGRRHPDDQLTPLPVGVNRETAARFKTSILSTAVRDLVDAYFAHAEAVEGLIRLRNAIIKRARMRRLHMAYARKSRGCR